MPACQVTLKNLQLDYLDLYLIHWPYTFPKGKTLYTAAEEDKFGYSAETEAKCWEVILISIGRMPFNFCVSCVDLLMFERSDCFSMISCPQGLEEAAGKGLTKQIGTSNYSITKTEKLLETAKIVPAVNQVESHAYLQQLKLKEYCCSKGPFVVFSLLYSVLQHFLYK